MINAIELTRSKKRNRSGALQGDRPSLPEKWVRPLRGGVRVLWANDESDEIYSSGLAVIRHENASVPGP